MVGTVHNVLFFFKMIKFLHFFISVDFIVHETKQIIEPSIVLFILRIDSKTMQFTMELSVWEGMKP